MHPHRTPFTTVKIGSKLLVKAYLENNFGKPVQIPEGHVLSKLACSQLVKDNTRPDFFREYPESIDLTLCERNFKFDGFNINAMNTRNFNIAVVGYIRDLWRVSLDGLLMRTEKQISWKKKCIDLLERIRTLDMNSPEAAVIVKILKKDLQEDELEIKEAIEFVITDVLRLDFDVLSYDTVKKDYYRYKKRQALALEINI